MIIIKSEIFDDQLFENLDLDSAKLNLADEVIREVSKEINNDNFLEFKELKILNSNYENKRKQAFEIRKDLKEVSNSYSKLKKVNELLKKVKIIIESGIFERDSNLKHEITILMRVIEDLPEKKLDMYLLETINIIKKRI